MSASATTPALSAATSMGTVSLTVRDLARTRAFYESALGMRATVGVDGSVALGVADAAPLLVLHEDPDAPRRDPHAPGLFHVALLLPSRRDLASALRRLARAGWPLSGASDHLVSEALYLDDPEGNGLELYRDRPREDWPRDAHGDLVMATLPLDLRELVSETADAPDAERQMASDPPLPKTTRVGHVHLQVSDIPRAEAFYADLLGFAPTVRGYPGALFVSAGGYHHHLGLNTWNSAGAKPAAPGAAGLRTVDVIVGGDDELARVSQRLRAAEMTPEPLGDDGAIAVPDPFGSTVVLRPA